MAFTITTAIQEVRYLLNEATASFWTDTELENWIKQGCMDLSTKMLNTSADGTVTLVQDQIKYVASDESWIANKIRCEVIWYQSGQNSRGLQRIEPHMLGHLQIFEAGEPRYFYENGPALYLWPAPSATEAGNTCNVIYSKATEDITELRQEYQQLVFLYAVSMAKAKDRKYQEAGLFQQMYLNSLNFERQDKFNMGTDPTATFTQP